MQNITILPQNDTIHIGDTLRFTTLFESTFKELDETIDISEEEIHFYCYINRHFFNTNTGIENFEFILQKGIIKNSEILYDGEGANREFFYELTNGKFEAELEIVAKETGYYILKLFSKYNYYFSQNGCGVVLGIRYYFEIDDIHTHNDYFLENSETLDRNSFYAFVVVE